MKGAFGLAALYSSAQIPSFLGALPEFVWRIVLSISSMEGGRSSSWRTDCWRIWFKASGSTVDGLLCRLLKCSAQRFLIPTSSLIKGVPSENSKGNQPDLEGPCTVFSELMSFLALWESA